VVLLIPTKIVYLDKGRTRWAPSQRKYGVIRVYLVLILTCAEQVSSLTKEKDPSTSSSSRVLLTKNRRVISLLQLLPVSVILMLTCRAHHLRYLTADTITLYLFLINWTFLIAAKERKNKIERRGSDLPVVHYYSVSLVNALVGKKWRERNLKQSASKRKELTLEPNELKNA
jgi:hypothetical protein